MTEESVPVIFLGNRVPGPVREFRVHENDAHTLILGVGVAPDVPIALGIVARLARLLEPGMLIGSVVQNQFDDDTDTALVGGLEECLKIFEIAVTGVDRPVFSDVVAIITQR